MLDVVPCCADEKRKIAMHAAARSRNLVGQSLRARRCGIGIRHLENRRHAAQDSAARAGLQILFVNPAGLPKMHLCIDHPRQKMEPAAIQHRTGRGSAEIADRRDHAGLHADIARPLAIVVDDQAILQNEIETGHRNAPAPRIMVHSMAWQAAHAKPAPLARCGGTFHVLVMNAEPIKAALLADRGIVKVAGEEARRFLNGIVTIDMDAVAPDRPRFGAILTPQGKIIVDFLVVEASPEDGGGFFFDCPRALAPALAERLKFYRLRTKVTIEDLSEALAIVALWGGPAATEYGLIFADPRLPALGQRCLIPPAIVSEALSELGASHLDQSAYEAHRIALGIPHGGRDFIYGDAFPHEADMDQLHGVDFQKGCFVGQEVVSRMEHRANVRTRIVAVTFDGPGPEAGIPVIADGKPVGTMGSAANGHGIALLRLDRVGDALAKGASLSAGGLTIRLSRADWAHFDMPVESRAAE